MDRRTSSSRCLMALLALLLVMAPACSQFPLDLGGRRASTPKLTPTATPTPLDLPPTVVTFAPLTGQEVPPEDARVTVRFDQSMDRESVEGAFRLTPEAEGEFSWEDDATMIYRPQGLASATRYQVSLGTEARATDGDALTQPLAFSFSTLGPLEITRVSPDDGAEDLRTDTPLLIAFNRPMVPINCTGAVAGRTDACSGPSLTLNPSLNGDGYWVNTSLYRFEPRLGWKAGTTYEIRVDAGVISVAGAILASPYTWSFTTAVPRILDVKPIEAGKNVLLGAAVRVNFNTPMDPEATGSAFNLVSEGGEPVPGGLTWEDGGARLVFTPTQRLELDTRYVAQVGERARSLTGALLENPLRWSFTTVPYPAPVAASPTDGTINVPLYEPVGIRFQGAISRATVAPQLSITPTLGSGQRYLYWDDDVLLISWDKEPRTEYCVGVQPGVRDLYGNATEEGLETCFTTGDLSPAFSPATGLSTITLDAEEPPRLYVISRNVSRASLNLWELSEKQFVAGNGVRGQEVRGWTERFTTEPNEAAVSAVDLTRRGAPLTPGYYGLTWSTTPEDAGWRREMRIAVVDRHVTLKVASEEALVWVTDLRSGEPVTSTEVRLLDETATLLAAGTTDDDGLARIRMGPLESLWDRVTAVVGVPGQAGFGVAATEWDAGASPWEFDFLLNYGPFAPYHVYLYTDRPIYRPGQTIRVRGILREEEDVRYSLPDNQVPVELRLRDPDWDVIYTTTATLSDLGGFDAAFELSQDALLGSYAVQARLPGVDRTWEVPLNVAAYRKPEFQVAVIAEEDDVLQAETVRVLVEAEYYFGGPVSDAEVNWTVRSMPYRFAPDVPGWWNWGTNEGPWVDEIVTEGKARTDGEGRLLLEIPADLRVPEEGEPGSQRWEIEVTVTEESGFPVSARAGVTVHASNFYLGLKPEAWVVSAGEKLAVDALALDWDENPLSDRNINVVLAQREWYQIPAERPFAPSTWGYTDTVISTLEVTTDGDGEAEAMVTPPQGGAYVIKASTTDEGGREVRSESTLWVTGPEGRAWRATEGQIEPVADAQSYRPGDTASIFVPTPFEGPFQVLMTVERGSFLEVRRFVSEESNPMVELTLPPSYAPNVYVSFVVVKGAVEPVEEGGAEHPPDVRVGFVQLTVEPLSQTLDVEVTADQTAPYRPGDEVELTVRTVDAAGQTVDAEVGLAVVDKAVLALMEPYAPSIVEGFYGERPLSVVYGDSSLVLFNRVAANIQDLVEEADRMAAEVALGGMGGGGGGDGLVAPEEVRQSFPDTALWATRIRTGLSGEAQLTFELPDSLTTWVADARAVTADTRVGGDETEIIVSKPLLIRPSTPRFFVAGDRAEVTGVVHNNTAEDLDVTVLLEASGVAVEGEADHTFLLSAGEHQRVTWMVSVPRRGSEEALLTFSVAGGDYEDAARPSVGHPPDGTLPVYRYETPDVMGASGSLTEEGSCVEAVVIPPEAGVDTELVLRLEPSLAASMVSGLTYLENSPYNSTEQIVSRFLPNILTYRALRDLGLDEADLEANLEEVVLDGLDRLYGRQNEDGGWGWLPSGRSDLQVSAYVALGLWEAQQAGFTVREGALSRTLDYVSEALAQEQREEPRSWAVEHALAFYVLTLVEEGWPGGVAGSLYAARQDLGATGQAYLALALGKADAADRRVLTLLDELRGVAEITASGAHWEDANASSWATGVRATAVVLKALIELAPDDPLISQSVRWLMIARRGDRWTTTQETVWSLIALTDYMVATGELQANYTWGVALNGVPLEEGTVAPDVMREVTELEVGLSEDPALGLVRGRTNGLEIARGGGPGRLTYVAHMALYRSIEEVEAESRGITVRREYCAVQPASDDETCVPVTAVRAGDLVEVRLTLVVPQTRYYLTLEDVYPAGMEPVDPTLLTEQQGQPEPGPMREGGRVFWWWDPFDHRELRDERALFFARTLAPGNYQVQYRLRAVTPGEYRVLPATASEMYFPEVWGRTAGTLLNVER